MVYSQEQRPLRGQEFRDRVRCEALDHFGFRTFTMDNKHSAEGALNGRHCTANFADTHRMQKAMDSTWGPDFSFDLIVLDYFFSPAGWAKVRWAEAFFEKTLPFLAAENKLSVDGSLWMPHIDHVEEMLKKYEKVLSEHFEWRLQVSPSKNPLYAATDRVTRDLLRTPDFMTNESQLKPLLQKPFYEFKRKTMPALFCPQMSPLTKKAATSVSMSGMRAKLGRPRKSRNVLAKVSSERRSQRLRNRQQFAIF